MKLQYKYSELSHKGNVRSQNEDSHIIKKTVNGELFVVCDGMGGAVGGKTASTIAVKSIVEYFERGRHENKAIALSKAIEFANEQIYATTLDKPELKGMGTTCCIMIIDDNEIYYAHVGDSRIYLSSDGELYHLTKDHSFVMQLVDQGTITVEEAQTHRDKNRILKALGVQPSVIPSVIDKPIQLKKGDTVMMCSDGLNDMVNDILINGILTTPKSSLDEKTHRLVELALMNGGKDNITIQTISITNSPFSKSIFKDQTIRPKVGASDPLKTTQTAKKDSFSSLLKYFAIVGGFLILGTILFFLIPKGEGLLSNLVPEKESTEKDVISPTESDNYKSDNKDDKITKDSSTDKPNTTKEDIVFQQIMTSNKVGDCVNFLAEFPNTKYLEKVDERAWYNARNNKQKKVALELYIKHFDIHRQTAIKELDRLNNKGKTKKIEPKIVTDPPKTNPKVATSVKEEPENLPQFEVLRKNGTFPTIQSILVFYQKYANSYNLTEENLLKWSELTDINSIPDGTRIYLVPKKKDGKSNVSQTIKEEASNQEDLKTNNTENKVNTTNKVENDESTSTQADKKEESVKNLGKYSFNQIKGLSNLNEVLNCAFRNPDNIFLINDIIDNNKKISLIKGTKTFTSLSKKLQNKIFKKLSENGQVLELSECNDFN